MIDDVDGRKEVNGQKCRFVYQEPNYTLMTPASRTLGKRFPPFDMPFDHLLYLGQLVKRKSIISV